MQERLSSVHDACCAEQMVVRKSEVDVTDLAFEVVSIQKRNLPLEYMKACIIGGIGRLWKDLEMQGTEWMSPLFVSEP